MDNHRRTMDKHMDRGNTEGFCPHAYPQPCNNEVPFATVTSAKPALFYWRLPTASTAATTPKKQTERGIITYYKSVLPYK